MKRSENKSFWTIKDSRKEKWQAKLKTAVAQDRRHAWAGVRDGGGGTKMEETAWNLKN